MGIDSEVTGWTTDRETGYIYENMGVRGNKAMAKILSLRSKNDN